MKKRIYLICTLLSMATAAAYACTSLLAGRKATTDGSTLITYAADSHTLYGTLWLIPAADHPAGSFVEIRDCDTNKPLGKIPQVPAYLQSRRIYERAPVVDYRVDLWRSPRVGRHNPV